MIFYTGNLQGNDIVMRVFKFKEYLIYSALVVVIVFQLIFIIVGGGMQIVVFHFADHLPCRIKSGVLSSGQQ